MTPSARVRRLVPVVAVLAAAIAVRVLFTIDRPPARFWDTYSYVAVSLQVRAGEFPHLGVRPIGYPLFLAATSRDGTGDLGSIRAQMLLGTASSLLVFLSLNLWTRKRGLSLALALLTCTFVDLLYAEATLYSETLSAFLVMCAVFALAQSDATRGRRWRAWGGVSAALSIATLVRPIFLVPLTVLACALAVLSVRRRIPAREAVVPIAVAFVVLGPFVIANGLRSGLPAIAVGPGTSLLNYAGFPALYDHFPERFSKERQMYQSLGTSRPDGFVGWWEAMPALDPAGYPDLSDVERDRVARRLAISLIGSAPIGYLEVWLKTVREFLFEVDVGPGFYVDPEHMAEGDSTLPSYVRIIATRLQALWGSINWLVTLVGGFVLPLALMLAGSARARSLPFTLLWGMVWATVLASTLLEPCPGQARYRWPLQLPFVVLSGWAVAAGRETLISSIRVPHDLEEGAA